MNRRDLLKAALLALVPRPAFAASVSTLIGNGSPGLSDSQVNNPYGITIARDGGLYFCDVDNQLMRRFDFAIADDADDRRRRATRIPRRRRPGDGGIAEYAARGRVRCARPHVHRRARQPRRPQGRWQNRHHLDAGGNGRRRVFGRLGSCCAGTAAAAAQHLHCAGRPAADLRYRQPSDSRG